MVTGQVMNEAILSQLATLWTMDAGTVRLVSDGINRVFRFEDAGRGRYLRLSAPAICEQALVEQATAFLLYIIERGAPACSTVLSPCGRYMETVSVEIESFAAQVLVEVPGVNLERVAPTATTMAAWGRSIAALHIAAEGFAGGASLSAFEEHWRGVGELLPTADQDLRDVYTDLSRRLNQLPTEPGYVGWTHGDCRRANVIWQRGKACIVDFDSPTWTWFTADLARALDDFVELPQGTFGSLSAALLAGYRSERTLPSEMERAMPMLRKANDLGMYAWIQANWGGDIAPGGGSASEWLAYLRRRCLSA